MAQGMREYAVWYVKKFHAIVPIGAWTFTGKDGKKVDLWKHPLIPNWTQEPLRTERQVAEEWNKFVRRGRVPGIGVVTGQICGGYIVIDLDNKPEKGINGYHELLTWQQRTGLVLPEQTWTAITGSGGYHLWFRTDRAMPGFVNAEYGIDLRADGNQVVVPPSLHPSGKRYAWEISPNDCECAEADKAVIRFIEDYRPADAQYKRSTHRGQGGERKMLLPPEILEGGRHRPLISLVGTLNRLGVEDDTIMNVVRSENEAKCIPPLTETELQKEIFPAIFRYEKGVSAEEWKDPEEYKKARKQRSWLEERKRRMMKES